MQAIAHKLQLQYQYQVSRLLKLSANSAKPSPSAPDLLSSCMVRMAQELREQFLGWTQIQATAAQRELLKVQPNLLWQLLEAPIQDISQIFEQARTEISHPQHVRESLFAQRLCHILTLSTPLQGGHPNA